MSYKVCTRCQFVVPSKKKLCTTCGSKSFHVFENESDKRQPISPAALELGATVERSMVPAMSAASISTTHAAPLMSPATRTVSGLREKFSAADEQLPANIFEDAWSKVSRAFLK